MKLSLALMLLLCFVLAGCKTSSPKGGNLSGEDLAFRLIVPGRDITLKQGQIVTIPIEIKRDRLFGEDVSLQIDGPQQIRIDPRSVMVRADAMPVANVRFAAPAHAPVGSYRINVMANVHTGEPASTEFTIKVKAQQFY